MCLLFSRVVLKPVDVWSKESASVCLVEVWGRCTRTVFVSGRCVSIICVVVCCYKSTGVCLRTFDCKLRSEFIYNFNTVEPCSTSAQKVPHCISNLLYELRLVSIFVLKYKWKSAVQAIFILVSTELTQFFSVSWLIWYYFVRQVNCKMSSFMEWIKLVMWGSTALFREEYQRTSRTLLDSIYKYILAFSVLDSLPYLKKKYCILGVLHLGHTCLSGAVMSESAQCDTFT